MQLDKEKKNLKLTNVIYLKKHVYSIKNLQRFLILKQILFKKKSMNSLYFLICYLIT